MLKKAVDLLESVQEEGKEDDRFHFRLGYALYYLDKKAEALDCFRCSRELNPEDPNTRQFILWCELTLDTKTAAASEESSFLIALNLNARFQPICRHDLEDALNKILGKSDMGFVDGGGTMMFPSGEVKSCDIELELNDDMGRFEAEYTRAIYVK